MTTAHRPAGLLEPADGYCPRWRRKLVYWSADQASTGLREFWAKVHARGWGEADRLSAYRCTEGSFEHWHLGKVER